MHLIDVDQKSAYILSIYLKITKKIREKFIFSKNEILTYKK